MRVENLASLPAGGALEADLVIIGGGPAGLTIAREFFGTSVSVLVLESGELQEEPRFTDLNAVESSGEPSSEVQRRYRNDYHGSSSPTWSGESQEFGVRCRVFGGSSQAWMGKSAPFDEVDFAARPWVRNSGWPFGRETLEPYIDRACEALNLGPFPVDSFWEVLGARPAGPALDDELLKSFFWQFARSRLDKMDIMRFGPEFLAEDAPNVRVVVGATVTRIDVNAAGTAFEGLEISTIDGVRSRVRARAAVLAASGIENPRLLLASNQVHAAGIGNGYDVVGRYLMDHPCVKLGEFSADVCAPMAERFGFYGLRRDGRTHMYMHGLALSPRLQQDEELLNCAVYMQEVRAPDDPWEALKRLLRRASERPLSDVKAVAASPGLLAKGLAKRILQSEATPEWFRTAVVDAMVAYRPNLVVREFQSGGLPHKLDGLRMEGICEQAPEPQSRITLSDQTDALGVPMANVRWRIGDQSRQTLLRLGELVREQFAAAGLPGPRMEDWIVARRPRDSIIIDMGHTLGATRMSENPKLGVVDANCQVHGVAGLYVAGGSVFPTSGHANPTLMIAALAIRLSDQLKLELPRAATLATGPAVRG